jgi:hypothetical protein
MNRVSEHPESSREWWRDWSAYWMRDAQSAAKLSKEMRSAGWLDLADQWRRIAIASLRTSLQDYKRSLTAHDASEWRP